MNQLNKESAAASALKKLILTLYGLLVLVPVSIVVLASFKEMTELFKDPLGWPEQFTLNNYMHMFKEQALGQYFMNSVFVTLSTIFCILFFSSLLAYAIYRFSGWKGTALYGLFAAGMMVPPQVNMIPIYSLVADLNLTNTLSGLIAVSIAIFMPVAVFILAGFMKSMPKEMIEAASIDGANEWQTYGRIVLPLSMPSISASAIFLSVMIWNDLLFPLLLINSSDKKTLPLALLQFQGEFMTNFPMIFAGVIIASAPMVIAYVLLQRYFVEGVTAGSVKG
ncbi:carbohydrate ABC transporter permease [Paenibacillus sp. YYML68]|uniref:carbohydrate ABC transporter permease n=1 Tax=Paenibacillus sp. YYML68 TaxID=2909250 RepID=UPI002493A1B1|nr:carbohydrate ABC transporter permease [Paenibacillus sp. YYML68]